MAKKSTDASAARTVNRPLFILSLVVRVIAVLAAVFCLYRVAQLVGGNNVSLSDTQITAAVRNASGRTVHTSGDLRKNTGSSPETADLADGFICEIASQKNARKKYIQVTLTVKGPDGETVWQSEAEPLQFTEDIHADISMVFTAADGSISADVSTAVKEARHISDNLLIYCLGLAAGIAVFAVVSTASRHF